MNEERWEDVIIWDSFHFLAVARQQVHDAFLARQRGDFGLCSTYASKALETLSDCEKDYPEAVAALRNSLEKL